MELIPEGKHNARLIWIIDLGTHKDVFQGQEKFPHKIYLGFELVDTAMADGRPFMWGHKYNITNGKFGPYISRTSNLFKMLKGWQKDWDEKKLSNLGCLGSLIGAPARLTIAHEPDKNDAEKIWAVCESIKPVNPKEEVAMPTNKTILYALGDPCETELAPWILGIISQCLERNGGIPKLNQSEDDMPF